MRTKEKPEPKMGGAEKNPMNKNSSISHNPQKYPLFDWAVCAGIFLIAIFAYQKGFRGEFIFDDTIRIAAPFYESGTFQFRTLTVFDHGLLRTLKEVLPDRPALMFTIWLNYFFGGADPVGYKAVNILLHAANGVLAYFLLGRCARALGLPRYRWLAALLAAAFVAHPLNSQAVVMVIQRGVLLSFFCGGLTLYYWLEYLERPHRASLLAASLFFLIGLLSKSNIIVLPLVGALFAYHQGRFRRFIPALPLSFGLATIPAIFYFVFRDNFHAQTNIAPAWINYPLIQTRVVVHYLTQVFYPVGLNSSYPIPLQWQAIAKPVLLGCVAFHFTAIALIVRGARRGAALAISAASFYVMLLPESSVFPIPHVVFDHRMYFPLFFVALSLYALFARASHAQRKMAYCALALALIALTLLTRERVLATNTFMGWLETSTRAYKHDHRANLELVTRLLEMGERERGLGYVRELREKYPEVTEYARFERIFRAGDDWLRAMGEVLLEQEKNWNYDNVRGAMLSLYAGTLFESGRRQRSNETSIPETIFVVLRQNSPAFSYSPSYQSAIQYYYRACLMLHARYRRDAALGLLTANQELIWIDVLDELFGAEQAFGPQYRISPESTPLLILHRYLSDRGARELAHRSLLGRFGSGWISEDALPAN